MLHLRLGPLRLSFGAHLERPYYIRTYDSTAKIPPHLRQLLNVSRDQRKGIRPGTLRERIKLAVAVLLRNDAGVWEALDPFIPVDECQWVPLLEKHESGGGVVQEKIALTVQGKIVQALRIVRDDQALIAGLINYLKARREPVRRVHDYAETPEAPADDLNEKFVMTPEASIEVARRCSSAHATE